MGANYARDSEQVTSVTAFTSRGEYLSSSGRNASDDAPASGMSDTSRSQAQSWGVADAERVLRQPRDGQSEAVVNTDEFVFNVACAGVTAS
jgi:hypothetical protein